jgi:hypothetical protein
VSNAGNHGGVVPSIGKYDTIRQHATESGQGSIVGNITRTEYQSGVLVMEGSDFSLQGAVVVTSP